MDTTGILPLHDGSFASSHPAAQTLTLDSGKMRIRSVISTSVPDRAGDLVMSQGLRNTEEFLMNPVVLWAHNRTGVPPIGICRWLDVQPTRIVAETEFAQGVPFAEDVFRLYEQGILKGWSIGFLPRRTQKVTLPSGRIGVRIDEWELLEYSAVPIPENPEALTIALQKGFIRDRTLRDWLRPHTEDVMLKLVG